ncbi:hypothetical protein ACE1TI_09560 [Alteribacillus sp. JSM 102045]|uniref:hypothetical protein n=1 Tax=Alteribacillus sp. JSM 102045 TaxID=1562101 RepID=UPI0035C154F0
MIQNKTFEMTKISMLACFIAVTGMIKIPSPIPGSEFQLSAPIAVAIVAVFGFWRYMIAGMLSSTVLFLLGLHTIINVEISMIFRLTVGLIVSILGPSAPVLLIAGPIGSLTARIGLAETLQVNAWPLIIGAVPGMIFTMAAVLPITKALKRVSFKTEDNRRKSKAIPLKKKASL